MSFCMMQDRYNGQGQFAFALDYGQWVCMLFPVMLLMDIQKQKKPFERLLHAQDLQKFIT